MKHYTDSLPVAEATIERLEAENAKLRAALCEACREREEWKREAEKRNRC